MNLQRTSTTPFGLVAWLEQTQIHLPLKAIECHFEVFGAAVDVQIDQVFHQTTGRPLDVTYSFPLPSKAAAYRCEMIVNGRTIRAIESAFCPDDAKKLTRIVLDWAKHVDDQQVKDTLRVLLRVCELDGDARFLRKVLSNFFLALPDPWRTKASSIFSALSPRSVTGRSQ